MKVKKLLSQGYNFIIKLMKPTNNRFAEEFEKMRKDLGQLSRIPQPQLIGWAQYSPSDFAGNATPQYLLVDSGDIFSQIRKGFVVRLKESGDSDYRYFWVVAKGLTDNRIYIAGGDSYVLTGAAIVDIGFSSSSSVAGFPRFLDMVYDMSGSTSNIQVTRSSTTINSINKFDLRLRMDGELMHVEYEVNFEMYNFDFQLGLKLPDDLIGPALTADPSLSPISTYLQRTVIPLGICTFGLFDPVTTGADDNPTFAAFTRDGVNSGSDPYAAGVYIGVRTTPFDVGFGTNSANESVAILGYIDYEIIDS